MALLIWWIKWCLCLLRVGIITFKTVYLKQGLIGEITLRRLFITVRDSSFTFWAICFSVFDLACSIAFITRASTSFVRTGCVLRIHCPWLPSNSYLQMNRIRNCGDMESQNYLNSKLGYNDTVLWTSWVTVSPLDLPPCFCWDVFMDH